MIIKTKKSFIFSNQNWEPVVPVVVHQDLEQKKCVKLEVVGSSGWIVLSPDGESKTRFKSEGREPTIVDFGTMVYSCGEGSSTFKVGDSIEE